MIDSPTQFDSKKMQASIDYLSQERFQEPGFGSDALDETADWIASEFKSAGLEAQKDKSYFQQWQAIGGEPDKQSTLKNVIALSPEAIQS